MASLDEKVEGDKDKIAELEIEIFDLPTIKTIMDNLSAICSEYKRDRIITCSVILARGLRDRKSGNAGLDAFFEKYFPGIEESYNTLVRIKESYDELSRLNKTIELDKFYPTIKL